MGHFIILFLIIIAIVIWQIIISYNTKELLQTFQSIFPNKPEKEFAISKDADNGTCISSHKLIEDIQKLRKDIDELNDAILTTQNESYKYDIYSFQSRINSLNDELSKKYASLDEAIKRIGEESYTNSHRQTIIKSINNYLLKNRNSTSDFYLIKDIVDRNCDSAEEEINTRIPMPLYLGLAGTMIGIIIGVGSLWLSGGLSDLLNADASMSNGANGIETLIGGVAFAMIASLFGIGLTTSCSMKTKDAKRETESNKHKFLSWIQAELLPVLSTDVVSSIKTMTDNLNEFNSTFSSNTKDFAKILSDIKETSNGQAQLLDTVNNLDIKKIATANIKVYDALKNSTNEIGLISEQLKASQEYLQQVRELSKKLDDADQRSRLIEEMANYFVKERSNIDAIKGIIATTTAETNAYLQDTTTLLRTNVSNQYSELTQHLITERERFEKVADEQQAALEKRMDEIKSLTAELKNLSAVKSSMESLVKATESQNKKLDSLSTAISKLALKKSGADVPTVLPFPIPRWVKITAVACAGIVVLSCLLLAIMAFIR